MTVKTLLSKQINAMYSCTMYSCTMYSCTMAALLPCFSARLGMKEDLEDIRKEEEEKKRKLMKKAKKMKYK